MEKSKPTTAAAAAVPNNTGTSIVVAVAAAAAASAAAAAAAAASGSAPVAPPLASASTTTAPKPEIKRVKMEKSLPVPPTTTTGTTTGTTTAPQSQQVHQHSTMPPSTMMMAQPASSGPLVLPNPPVAPPLPDSLTIRAMNSKLDAMWNEQKREMKAIKSDTKAQFKHISDLPLARIKRVMKSDEEVRMISAEAPILFAKACEMFVLDLTTRCYAYSEHNKRAGLEREDVFQVLKETNVYDFLAEVLIFQPVPK